MKRKKMTDEHNKFRSLGWKILEHKCHYYTLNRPIISDYEYDMLEKEYERLAKQLGLRPMASDMVDFDLSRPACALVFKKIGSRESPDYIEELKQKFGGK